MKKILTSFVFLALMLSAGAQANEATRKVLDSLNWVNGPKVVNVGASGTFQVPQGFVFLGNADTKRYLEEVTQNPSSGNENMFAPADGSWWAIFRFERTGHVLDDEKIDADALMKNMRTNQDEDNKDRQSKGYPLLLNLAWQYPPFYDPATKRLEWAKSFISSDTNSLQVNYESRFLGREGVMSAILVTSPEQLPTAMPAFKAATAGYDFIAGKRYSEFKQCDRVAEYGLAALIAGGAAAVATNKGWWAAILGSLGAAWKFIALGAAGFFAWLRSLSKKKT